MLVCSLADGLTVAKLHFAICPQVRPSLCRTIARHQGGE